MELIHNIGVGGIITAISRAPVSHKHDMLITEISEELSWLKRIHRFGTMAHINFNTQIPKLTKMLENLIDEGEILSVNKYKNLTTTVFRTEQASRMAGGADSANITYGAVGDDGTAAAVGDTALTSEIFRTTVTLLSNTATAVDSRLFLNTSQGNPSGGTILEFGWFGSAASATPNSGTLVTHTIVSEAKASSNTLTFQHTINVNDA